MKNIKIDKDVHEILKNYCNKEGIKIHKFVEKVILNSLKKEQEANENLFKMQERKDS